MNMWSSLLSGGAQEQVVKRACGRSFILEGAVHHVEGCSCRAVSVIEELHSESPGFFQANNPQSIAGELFAAATEPFSVVRCPRVRETEGIKWVSRETRV